MPMEYIVRILCITAFTNMEEPDIMEEWLAQLVALEEDRFIANFISNFRWPRIRHGMIDIVRKIHLQRENVRSLYH